MSRVRPRSRRAQSLVEVQLAIALCSILGVGVLATGALVAAHVRLASGYADDLRDGARVLDAVLREARAARRPLLRGGARTPGPRCLLLETRGGGSVALVFVPERRPGGFVVREEFDADGVLLSAERLGRVGSIELQVGGSSGQLVSATVDLEPRAPGAARAVLVSSALVGAGERTP